MRRSAGSPWATQSVRCLTLPLGETSLWRYDNAQHRQHHHVDVLQRLAGNFPVAVADLHYRFTLDSDLIRRLVIEP